MIRSPSPAGNAAAALPFPRDKRDLRTRGLVDPSRTAARPYRGGLTDDLIQDDEYRFPLKDRTYVGRDLNLSSSSFSMSPAYIEALPQGRHQLVVPDSDGKNRPFFCIPAEINNSSFSDPSYISTIFPRLKEQGFNTLLCGVGWEQIEPTEGNFSFERLDACVQRAREEGLRLVLLWFGAFKNGQ